MKKHTLIAVALALGTTVSAAPVSADPPYAAIQRPYHLPLTAASFVHVALNRCVDVPFTAPQGSGTYLSGSVMGHVEESSSPARALQAGTTTSMCLQVAASAWPQIETYCYEHPPLVPIPGPQRHVLLRASGPAATELWDATSREPLGIRYAMQWSLLAAGAMATPPVGVTSRITGTYERFENGVLTEAGEVHGFTGPDFKFTCGDTPPESIVWQGFEPTLTFIPGM